MSNNYRRFLIMFYCTIYNNKYRKSTLAILLLFVTFCSFADKYNNQITQIISSIEPPVLSKTTEINIANSSVTLDFSLAEGESWDEKDSTNNVLSNCFNGKSITGFDYSNITIQTIGGSFLSEAVIYFSSSNNGDDGIQLTVGSNNETSGTASFSSVGVLDITDSGNLDVLSLSDNQFNLQLYEKIDDAVNTIDARFTNGTLTVLGVDLVANNSCPFVINSITDADLSVTHTSSLIGNNEVGSSVEMVVTVTNNSTQFSGVNVRLSNTLSSNLTFTEANCDDMTNTMVANEIELLQVNDIAANSSLQCTLTAEITALGNYSNDLTVLSDNDVIINNNSVIIVITGTPLVVPINSLVALLMLAFGLFYTSRKPLKA